MEEHERVAFGGSILSEAQDSTVWEDKSLTISSRTASKSSRVWQCVDEFEALPCPKGEERP